MKKIIILLATLLIAVSSSFATDFGLEAIIGFPSTTDKFSDSSKLTFSNFSIGGAFNIFPEKNIGMKFTFIYLIPQSAEATYNGVTTELKPGESSIIDLNMDYVFYVFNSDKFKINLNAGFNFLFRTYSFKNINKTYKETNYGPEVGLGASYFITRKVYIKGEGNVAYLFLGSSSEAEKTVWYIAPQISAGFFF